MAGGYYDLRARSAGVPDLGYTIVPVHPAPFGKSFNEILVDIARLRWSGLVEYHSPDVALSARFTWAFEHGRMLWKMKGNQLPREPEPMLRM